jgi:hypothetical protein
VSGLDRVRRDCHGGKRRAAFVGTALDPRGHRLSIGLIVADIVGLKLA